MSALPMSAVTRRVIQVTIAVNLLLGLGFAVALLLSWPMNAALIGRLRLKYGEAANISGIAWSFRVALLIGIPAVVIVDRMLRLLLQLLASAARGDPFVAANAGRLEYLAWLMVALQVLNLGWGGLIAWLHWLHAETATWQPDFGGWLTVLLLFVLAQVFRAGTVMRDELAMTV